MTTPLPDMQEILAREIGMMQAAGWRLERRWARGADFVSTSKSSVSLGAHLILCLFTLGLWIPVMIVMELANSGVKRCRLTLDIDGKAQYDPPGP